VAAARWRVSQDKAKTEEELKTAAYQAATELDAQKAHYLKQLEAAKQQTSTAASQAQAGSKEAMEKAGREGRAREAALAETVQVRECSEIHVWGSHSHHTSGWNRPLAFKPPPDARFTRDTLGRLCIHASLTLCARRDASRCHQPARRVRRAGAARHAGAAHGGGGAAGGATAARSGGGGGSLAGRREPPRGAHGAPAGSYAAAAQADRGHAGAGALPHPALLSAERERVGVSSPLYEHTGVFVVYERRQRYVHSHSCAPSFGLPACKRPD